MAHDDVAGAAQPTTLAPDEAHTCLPRWANVMAAIGDGGICFLGLPRPGNVRFAHSWLGYRRTLSMRGGDDAHVRSGARGLSGPVRPLTRSGAHGPDSETRSDVISIARRRHGLLLSRLRTSCDGFRPPWRPVDRRVAELMVLGVSCRKANDDPGRGQSRYSGQYYRSACVNRHPLGNADRVIVHEVSGPVAGCPPRRRRTVKIQRSGGSEPSNEPSMEHRVRKTDRSHMARAAGC